MKKENRKLLGRFGVDSGQVLITDPCYVRDFVNDEMDDKEPNEYSYSNCCELSLSKKQGGVLFNSIGCEVGVVATTGYGDGVYSVYATYKEGRIKKLEIIFF